ncbi:MAG: hypothetical protein V3T17_10535 [Pseudomonadales bacterium]
MIKRQCVLWGFTLATLALLLAVGLVASLGVKHYPLFLTDSLIHALPWGWWRGWAYLALVAFWPYLVKGLLQRRYAVVTTNPDRRPLLVLIVLYEGLIVQNPLAWLFRSTG